MCEHRCLLKTEYEELKIKYLKLDSDRFWGDVVAKCKIREKIKELDNQQKQWIEDRELKNSDAEIIFAKDILEELLEE